MIVNLTHHDMDFLFGRWNIDLKKRSFPTILLLIKSFMNVEAINIIPHFIKDVPILKGSFEKIL